MRGSDTVWSEENVYKVFDLTLSGRAGLDIFVSQIFAIVKGAGEKLREKAESEDALTERWARSKEAHKGLS
jgi:hypothetical protein